MGLHISYLYYCRQTCVLFIITFISIVIYGLLSEINWMDGWIYLQQARNLYNSLLLPHKP